MRIAYFDCFSGISGDMIVGALIDAGVKLKELRDELDKLKISGFKLRREKTARGGLSGTKFNVEVHEEGMRRTINDIISIIDKSDLSTPIKKSGKKIFLQLATVEAKIHNKSIEKIHFHEVGGLDSIIDIIGSLICLNKLEIEAVYTSKIHLGTGFVQTQHGNIPVPVPATIALLKGVPVYSTGIQSELVTPTGAAILKTLCKSFGPMPEMQIERIGYGAGNRELQIPNLLRVYIGESPDINYEKDNVIVLQTDLDDMNPQVFGYISELLLAEGALDVSMTPIFMKKARPGVSLSVMTTEEKFENILSIIFRETTTLGVRIHRLERRKLTRETIPIQTKWGKVRVKVGKMRGEIKKITPEYEDCRKIATEQGLPLKDVYEEVKFAALETIVKPGNKPFLHKS